METELLRSKVQDIRGLTDSTWLATLDKRKLAELEFHDDYRNRQKWASREDEHQRKYSSSRFYSTTARSAAYANQWVLFNAPGKVFLDYACGDGRFALMAARAGARLSMGFDISWLSVANAQHDADCARLDNAMFFQADAENTLLPDGCVDRVICCGMLHHLDLSRALPELKRILSPGGRILAIEALKYNPVIAMYRRLTPHMRTEWETAHILGLNELALAGRFFRVANVRYWHVCSYLGVFFPKLGPVLDALDATLSNTPIVQLMAWVFTFELLHR